MNTTKLKQTHRYGELTSDYQQGKEGELQDRGKGLRGANYWEDPEGSDGEGGGSGDRDGEYMHIHG